MNQLDLFSCKPQESEGQRVVREILGRFQMQDPSWHELAVQLIKEFPSQRFTIEDVRLFAEDAGFPMPGHRRAWGAAAVSARKRGIVKWVGYTSTVGNKDSHPTPVSEWEKS